MSENITQAAFEAFADMHLLAHTQRMIPATPYLEELAEVDQRAADALAEISRGIGVAYKLRDVVLLNKMLDAHRKIARYAVSAAALAAAERAAAEGETVDMTTLLPGIDDPTTWG